MANVFDQFDAPANVFDQFDQVAPPISAPPAAPPPAMSGISPVPTTLQTFFHNLPAYVTGMPGRFADLAKGAVTGDILPQSANMAGGERQGDIPALISAAAVGMPLSPGGIPMKMPPFKGPTEAALEASETARYQSPEVAGLQLKPEAGEDLSNIIKTDLKAAKLDQFNAKPYYEAADRLKTPRFGDNLTIADLEAARQAPDEIASPANATSADKRAGPVIRNAIDSYIGNIPENHVLSGDAAAANDALLKARADFAALKRSQDVTKALQRAENKTGDAETLTKNQLRPILDVKTGASKVPGFEDYTPDEIDALRKTMFPGYLQQKVGDLGRHLGSSGGLGHTAAGFMAGSAAHQAGADPMTSILTGLGSMAAGKMLGSMAGRMAEGRGDYLGNLLRSRSALANEMRLNPQMIPALWPQLLRAAVPVPALGINSE